MNVTATQKSLASQREEDLVTAFVCGFGCERGWGWTQWQVTEQMRLYFSFPHNLLYPALIHLPIRSTVQDIVFQLQRFVSTMSKYYDDCYAVLRDADVFPIEVDLARTTLSYGQKDVFTDGAEEEEEDGGDREGSRKEEANGEKLIDDA